ncbi:uncharacterized protein LOC131156396 [Malania oleifera]|uniref:uncharacterized protein LOC131156396 n=1 Tax=Malania oleifera TaxID=397392 RepID=UPI0025AE8E3C|nr:uncharacterized protein LOC131156396 [Malania oleifera]
MEKMKILMLLILCFTFAVFMPRAQGQPKPVEPSPLCVSQFALVDHACSLLPFNPHPSPHPPSPPSPDGDGGSVGGHEHGHINATTHGHRHRHVHRHRPRQGHRETPVEEECCRWLKEVDAECVCAVLVRLPPFLSKPLHEYTIKVDDSCTVSFECGGD